MHIKCVETSLLVDLFYAFATQWSLVLRCIDHIQTLRNPLVELITGGNITGSLFTGTIGCRSAVVTVTGQGKVTNPSVQIFGEAEGRSPFIATAHGVGEVGAHLARVQAILSLRL
jgi:hypothetical protein